MSAAQITLAGPSRKAAGAHRDPHERRGRRGAEPGRHRNDSTTGLTASAADAQLADAS